MSSPWRVISLLSVVSCVGYLVRSNIAIAQEYMAPDLGLSMAQMGVISAWGFQLAYTMFQVPAGLLGERVGARTALMLALLGCSVASLATALTPTATASAVPTLWLTRLLLGVSQAAIFPVAAMAVTVYVPAGRRVRATSFYIAAGALGAALAPLLMAPTMEWFGWRAVFGLSGVVAAATAVVWRLLLPPPVVNEATTATAKAGGRRREIVRLLAHRPLLRLSLAYLLHSAVWFVFVFWFFRYLVDGRGFTVLASGIWASLPSIAGFMCAPVVGAGADRLGARIGAGRARRRVAMCCLVGAASFVGVGALLPKRRSSSRRQRSAPRIRARPPGGST